MALLLTYVDGTFTIMPDIAFFYVYRPASSLKNTHGKQRALRKIFGLDLFLLKRDVLPQVIRLTPFNQSQQLTANCALLAMMSNYFRYLRVSFSAVHKVKEIQSSLIRHNEHIDITGRSSRKVTRLSSVVT